MVGAVAAAAGALLAPTPARALLGPRPENRLDAATRFFDLVALTNQEDGSRPTPGWVRKWIAPVRVRLQGVDSPRLAAELEAALVPLSRWTGLPMSLSSAIGPADILIDIKPQASEIGQFGRGGQVCTCATYGWSGRLHTGRIEISQRHDDCLRHELMHALGFDNHWDGDALAGESQDDDPQRLRSALALRHSPYRASGFSRWDELAIRTLYHPDLRPRMPRARALPIARRILSSLMNG